MIALSMTVDSHRVRAPERQHQRQQNEPVYQTQQDDQHEHVGKCHTDPHLRKSQGGETEPCACENANPCLSVCSDSSLPTV